MRLTSNAPCRNCGEHPRYITPKGRVSSRCRSCNTAVAAAWNAANRGRRRETLARFRETNRANLLDYIHTWRATNPDRALAISRRQRAEHPEAVKAAAVKFRRTHPDRVADWSQRRRARLQNALVEMVQRSVVWERDAGACHICREPADPKRWHLEHIIPLVRGGEHSYANTAVAHPACNLRKGARVG